MTQDVRPRLLFLVTEDWYFLMHRLPMAFAAQRAGYDVHVACRVVRKGADIAAHGFTLHPLDWRRGSLNPLHVASIVRQVRALYRRVRPDIAHHVALQPVVIGSLAAIGLPLRRVNAFAGLGFVFVSRSLRARAMRPLMIALLRSVLNDEKSVVVVENSDDRAALAAIGVEKDRLHLVSGSGVDIDKMRPLPEPAGEVTAAFVGRLLDDKGVRPLVAAFDLVRGHGQKLRLLIAGEPDPANPASISQAEIDRWKAKSGIEMLGHVEGIQRVWEAAHIAVLPSRREGLPVGLLEAAAFGRPIVATDVPGCREIARHGVNAFVVPPDDPSALAGALAVLARDADLRRKFGAAGRCMVENEFSSTRVGDQIVALYDSLIHRSSGAEGARPA
ncbi:MAG: glycosyltransferase family 4 protein [Pseudorhodoplanes sp.]